MVSLVQQHDAPVVLVKQSADTLVTGEGGWVAVRAVFMSVGVE
jgi:hypothetical protein